MTLRPLSTMPGRITSCIQQKKLFFLLLTYKTEISNLVWPQWPDLQQLHPGELMVVLLLLLSWLLLLMVVVAV